MKGSIIMTSITKVLKFNPDEYDGDWTDGLNVLIQRERMNSDNVLIGIEPSLDRKEYVLMFSHIASNKKGYQPKKLNEGSDKATYKQINYLKTLARNNDEVLTNVDFNTLTKVQAGKLIGKLKRESKNEQQDYTQEKLPGFNMDSLEGMFDEK